jgi:hypothetical protein
MASVAEHFETLLRMAEEGVALKHACRLIPGGPNDNSVLRWMKQHPERAAEMRVARMRASGSRYSPITAAAWETALEFVATSDAPQLTKAKWPAGVPSIDVLRRRARRDAAFAQRLDDALARRAERFTPSRFSEQAYRDAVSFLIANPDRRLADLSDDLARQKLPTIAAIHKVKQSKPWLAREFAKVSAARGVKRYTADAHAAAFKMLLENPHGIRRRLAAASDLPSLDSVRGRARHSDSGAEALQNATYARWKLRLEKAQARAKAAALRRQPADHLRQGLMKDDLYRDVTRLFSPAIPADVRDDMISAVVVAVLDGEIDRGSLAIEGKKIGARILSDTRRMDTLDRPAFAGSDSNIVDLITADRWTFEGAI